MESKEFVRELPILEDEDIKPIFLGDLPFPVREVLDKMASSLLSPGGGKVFVKGSSGVGKSYYIQQFANNIDEYLRRTDLDSMLFLKLNSIHLSEMQHFRWKLPEFISLVRDNFGLREEEVCIVIENPDIASVVALEVPKVKMIFELSDPTFNALMKNDSLGKTKFWSGWDTVDIDEIKLDKKELIDLLSASILPIENVDFKKRNISLFISYIFNNSDKFNSDSFVDEDGKTLIPFGLWNWAFRQVIGAYTFSNDDSLKKEGRTIYGRVMSKIAPEVVKVFSGYLEHQRSNKMRSSNSFLEQLEEIGLISVSSEGFPPQKPEESSERRKDSESLEYKDFSNLGDRLKREVIGQDEAVETLVSALTVPVAGIHDDTKPLGVFLFAGKSGVGKTSLALTLAKELSETELNVIRLDMSEYASKHESAKLFGSPQGYVGYEDGGVLTNAVKKHPNSILLLDEVEKANPDIWDSFLQVFDAGRMTDNKGETVDFTETIIIMTSNLGVKELSKSSVGFGTEDLELKNRKNKNIITQAIKEYFRPEFINRISSIIFFNDLSEETIKLIINKELEKVQRRLATNEVKMKSLNDEVIDEIVKKSDVEDYGAREIQRVIFRNIVSPIAERMIKKKEKQVSFSFDTEEGIVLN